MESMMARGIRSYGLGKFYKIIDQYVYEITMDGGADREESYPEGGGWYGFVTLDSGTKKRVHDVAGEFDDELTEEEETLLDETAAIIFYERSDGIVEASWYADMKNADEDWAEIAKEFYDIYDEDEDEAREEGHAEEEEE